MKLIAHKIRIQYTEDRQPELVLSTSGNVNIDELKAVTAAGKQLAVEIKQYRQKRSLDANSYCWVLITKIADMLRTSKDDVYIEMLKRYGQREPKLLSVVSDAADMVYRATQNHCCEVGESELNGKLFKHLAILIGSSQYDSRQMAILIDGIVSEAKDLNIETLSPQELKTLKGQWGK
jgi:hypothetical protein